MSVRTKFTLGVVFFFVIIMMLFIFPAIQLTKLSKKTNAILTENQVSVVCAREMSEAISEINHELTTSFIGNKIPDKQAIDKAINQFANALEIEKNNITEVGEEKLVSDIDMDFIKFKNSVVENRESADLITSIQKMQLIYIGLNKKLMLLSGMNEMAIEIKTNLAKESAKKALTQMAILGTFCFLIALTFTYNFATYFNERFTQLHSGIKEIVSSNYGQRLHFEGKDEFSDIALVFNEMAESLNAGNLPVKSLISVSVDNLKESELDELKTALVKIQALEEEVITLISKYKII